MNKKEAVALLAGRFIPDEPSMTFKLDIYSKTPFSSNDKYSTANKTVNAMFEIQSAMSLSNLIPPAEEEEEEDTSRLNKEKGGEVLDVPNTSKEPDERIDKMTGMPYNQQAGTAFTDVEDREDPLQRMVFGTGSMVTATTKGKVLSSLQRNVK